MALDDASLVTSVRGLGVQCQGRVPMDDIVAYSEGFEPGPRRVCERLFQVLTEALTTASCRLYHGSPVWFVEGNPVVGYSRKKAGISLLFWSGRSFGEAGLTPVGKFMAAEVVYASEADLDEPQLVRWLEEAKVVAWNYRDVVKNQGRLERL